MPQTTCRCGQAIVRGFTGVLGSLSDRLLSDSSYAHVLELRVVQDSVAGALPADSGLLHAAKGRDFGRDQAGVESHDAVFERLGDSPGAGEIARIEIGGQAKLRIVGHPDGLRFRLETEQGCDRAKRLFPR